MKKYVFLLAVVVAMSMVMPAMAYNDDDDEYDDAYADCSCDCDCEYCGCSDDDYDEYDDDEEDSYDGDDYDDEDDEDGCYCDCGCKYCYCCSDYDDDDEYYDYDWVPDVVWEYADAYGTIMIVDLENQHVYCCVNGEIIADADCVSGDLYKSPTPTGLYSVWCKQTDFYMMDAYYTAYAVFFNGGIAIHDADAWRSEYGGTIYEWGGSHGCINTPRWFAETVYENSKIGTPVYVF